jgi:hypothetical protein
LSPLTRGQFLGLEQSLQTLQHYLQLKAEKLHSAQIALLLRLRTTPVLLSPPTHGRVLVSAQSMQTRQRFPQATESVLRSVQMGLLSLFLTKAAPS